MSVSVRSCSTLLLFVALLALVACSASARPAPPPPAPVATAAPGGGGGAVPAVDPGVQAQVQRGAVVYAQACARCHGARGEGGAAPVLIGAAALPLQPRPGALVRTTPLRNAMDLGMFIKDQMPPGGPPTPPSDVAAVMAWILTSSGVTPPQAISPATAGGIRIR